MAFVSKALSGVNIIVLGDNTQSNEALCSLLAPLINYTPLHTRKIIQQLKGRTVREIVERESDAELGLVEAQVMEQLSSHIRCVISMCGDGIGAAARNACWRFIYSGVSIWLDEDPDGVQKPQHEAYCQSDVHVKVKDIRKEGQLYQPAYSSPEPEAVIRALLPHVLHALKVTLKGKKDLCKRKSLYIRLGCRGDWPDIDMPDWAQETED